MENLLKNCLYCEYRHYYKNQEEEGCYICKHPNYPGYNKYNHILWPLGARFSKTPECCPLRLGLTNIGTCFVKN